MTAITYLSPTQHKAHSETFEMARASLALCKRGVAVAPAAAPFPTVEVQTAILSAALGAFSRWNDFDSDVVSRLGMLRGLLRSWFGPAHDEGLTDEQFEDVRDAYRDVEAAMTAVVFALVDPF